jgi:cell division protein FtsI (penicillin-binding protein 3)
MERSALLPPLLSAAGPKVDRMAKLRLMLVALSISLWSIAIGVRLVMVQVVERDNWVKRAALQSERTIKLHPRRGPILDRNGSPLALSVEHTSIYAVPQDVVDPARTVAALAKPLELDAAERKEVLATLQSRRAFVWVRRKVDPAVARAVQELKLEGVGFEPETRRFYPQRELASHVVGFVNVDNEGGSGIESAFNEVIRGREQKVVVRTDARRRPMGHTERPSTDGHTIVLTLDEPIQHFAETELDRAMAETAATSGIVVVMDPRTGEILAMTNRPTFNPNRRITSDDRGRNRAILNAYEPGSIFKVITAAAAIEQKVVDPDEIIDCGGGSIEIGGLRINDHAVFHNLSFRDVIAKSSDVGVIKVAQKLGGRVAFEQWIRKFGFGAPTGVELPGESSGIFRRSDQWSALSLASLSFGQEIGVTALQMTMAMGAVANGGYLMKPLIVKQVETADGEVKQSFLPSAVRTVIQPSTVETLTDILKGVVTNGTGKRAAVPGYTVAGKTGTAQMIGPGGGYSMVDHVASFVGFVPAARPALVILVSLERPRGPNNEGGGVAAPVFARIAEQALRRLAVPSDDASHVLRPTADPAALVTRASYTPTPKPMPARPASAEGAMPSVIGLTAREAAAVAVRQGLMVELRGSGRVVEQVPDAGQPLEPGMTCRLVLERGGWLDAPNTPAVPVASAADGRVAQVTP